jgi:nitroreductase
MEKPAETNYPVNDLMRRRWSPRAFDNRRIPTETLLSILEAARWAASSRNEQPWRFLVATRDHPEDYERLLSCLNENNRTWAQRAPMLVLSAAKKKYTHNDIKNRYAAHDAGMALAHLVLQAVEYGIYAHIMAGFDSARAREVCAIPEEFEPLTITALGYPGDPSVLDESTRERELGPRRRKPLRDLTFGATWGHSPEFIDS